MPGPIRINFVALAGSVAAQGVILGGFVLAWQVFSDPIETGRSSPKLLTMALLPLGSDVHSSVAPGTAPRATRPEARDARARIDPNRTQSSFVSGTAPVAVSKPSMVVAPGAAIGASGASAAFSQYQQVLTELIARNSRYPAEARLHNLSGTTNLAFTLDRSGNVVDSWIQDSSGSEVLDDAALAALDRAQPLPPIPSGLPERMDFVIPIDSAAVLLSAKRAG